MNGVSKAKQTISTVNHITNIPITCERGNSYGARLTQWVADSCHVLESLIFMMLGHMRETHTNGNQCSSLYFRILIAAHVW